MTHAVPTRRASDLPAPSFGRSTPMKQTGNTILVTGGGSGIGEALAQRFHDLGNTVIVAGRRQEALDRAIAGRERSEEHTSELQSLMRISYAVFCLKKTKTPAPSQHYHNFTT